ncbi:LuxR C-terminal-related transcriptional regulator [Cohnella lupini]|uniref:LuxR family maltose regulon positive regulatory protein n=1 Tax=Cohnella lupini TaxID=1294267 RepID=A0A3D9I588_9BACL|nr:LuxR C-terminal-related transcriptional regulator [Cohnella lupini]RED56841.1 LuxR family maltose regulon positive regulatory protein [Cohnella lupini]
MKPILEPTLLHTKTSLPVARNDWVVRDRLIQHIERSAQGKVTLLSAPAGFGKTTLLSQWIRQTERTAAWVSLDDMDNDPVRFWRYVAEALFSSYSGKNGKAFDQLVRTLPGLSSSTFLDALINRLEEASHPVTLILEDYHLIAESRIHEGLTYFIEHLPRHIHIIVSSRSDLPFPTAKWKVREELAVIDALQLKFTLEETGAFCRGIPNIPFVLPHIEKLYDQTEGWITGLQLASISLRESTDFERFIGEFKGYHRNVAEYLFQEVVAKLPEDVRKFLLSTSALGRFDAKACNAVTRGSNGAVMLDKLKTWNLFLVPLDGYDTWFRYHHLFSEFLRNRVRKNDHAMWVSANLAASKSLAARGLMDEAIDHAIAAEEFSLTESLLTRHATHVLKRGEFPTLIRWFDSFPPEAELSPEMSLLYAFLLVVTGQPARADKLLAGLEKHFLEMEPGEARQQLQSGLLFVKSNLLFTGGDFEQWFSFIGGILDDILPHNPVFYNFNYNMTDPLVRRTAFGLKGVLNGNTETIGRLFADVLEKHGWGDSLINLYVVQSLAEGFYEWNRLEECQDLLHKVERAARLKLVPGLYVPNRITQAKLHRLRKQLDLAHEALDEALQFVSMLDVAHWTDHLVAEKVMLYLSAGQLSAAKKEAAKLRMSVKDRPTYHREFEYIAFSRLLGAQRKETEALRLLEALKPQAVREGSLMSIAEIAIGQAIMLDRLGQRTNSMRMLQEALTVGEANGYTRSFVDVGEPMEKLLHRLISHEYADEDGQSSASSTVSESYIRMLLSLFPQRQEREASSSLPVLVEPLTPAEINLLYLISQGFSNKLIAGKLSLSEGSVKVYTSRIYGKLGVSSRTQAVVAAQRLQLLPES